MKRILIGIVIGALVSVAPVYAQNMDERIKNLEESIRRQQETIQNQQRLLDELKEQIKQAKPGESKEGTTAAGRDYRLDDRSRAPYWPSASPVTPYSLTKQTTPSLMNPAIGLTLDYFYYNSSRSKEELDARTTPGYLKAQEPFREGFNLRSGELTLMAPVDPYFNLYATIPFEEDGVELEEAYFVTTALPLGLQVKGGKFKSGFGRFNAFHPHAWDFVDAPLPYKVFLGGEGLIEKGVQLTYLPPFPLYTLFGVEVLQGDNPVLYGSDAQSGPHAYTAFVKASVDFRSHHTLLLGTSVTGGKTRNDSFAADTEIQGDSRLYGLELTYKWKPSKAMGFTLQSEYLYRWQKGEVTDTTASATESLRREQDGMYVQALYQFHEWRFGARYDLLDIFRNEVARAGEKVSYDKRPYRYTGALEYNPTEFSRIRLQYNYDQSARAEKENHEIFLQFILAIGAHGAHAF